MMHQVNCEALDSVYELYRETLVGFARRFTDACTAEDVVQETFLQLLQYKRDSASDLSMAYLATVVRRVAARLDRLERRTASIDTVLRDPTGAETRDERTALALDFAKALGELPDRQWQSLVLTVALGLTDAAAGRALDRGRTSVAGARERAIASIRERHPRATVHRTPLLAAG